MPREIRGPDGRPVAVELLADPLLPMVSSGLPEHIELRGDLLVWRRPRCNPASLKGMLDKFLRVEDGDGVVKFTRQYGPLWLCNDGAPANSRHLECGKNCMDGQDAERSWQEHVEHWIEWVARANAILSVAAETFGATAASEGEISLLQDFTLYPVDTRNHDDLRDLVGLAVDDWIESGVTRPTFRWAEPSWHFSLTGDAFGMLGIQLMMAVSRSQGVAICDGCGTPYLRQGRKPQKGRKNFCLVCGDKVAARLRKRSQRESS